MKRSNSCLTYLTKIRDQFSYHSIRKRQPPKRRKRTSLISPRIVLRNLIMLESSILWRLYKLMVWLQPNLQKKSRATSATMLSERRMLLIVLETKWSIKSNFKVNWSKHNRSKTGLYLTNQHRAELLVLPTKTSFIQQQSLIHLNKSHFWPFSSSIWISWRENYVSEKLLVFYRT